MVIGEKLGGLSRSEILALDDADIKDPNISVVLSIFAGVTGADRFYIEDTGLGIVKLITLGGLGIWWLVDIFIISGRTKDKNADQVRTNIALYKTIYDY